MNEKILTCLAYSGISFNPTSDRQAPESIIQTIEKRFFPKYCAEGMKILAADVCDCYLHTKDTDPKKEECMIGDFTIVSVSTRANERAVVLGEVQKYNLFFSDE